ncbi:hypothetical protein GJ699_10325 [Duganella sp. FT80W]|jgi:hypothetical protein|uniref:Uncharacterized protein n=1 Tax=Duganella guangzhouensis TaxID=2666084 RepID=A0A6I2KXU9_9BURK|nr:hypothetical protein [Duganella guangzhouensis]MRW90382.1 hypothetical protein [Duganella guangzhouensis]
MRFDNLTSAEIREICRAVDEDMRNERAGKPRPKRFFDDWPSAQFTSEEIRAALDAAWKETFKIK